MTERVNHMGESVELSKLVRHYRWAARTWADRAAFFRLRLRVVIAAARAQRAERVEHREAA